MAGPVIVAHDSLNHCYFSGTFTKKILKQVLITEERVEIGAGNPRNFLVEHGVDVVRSALAGLYPSATAF